MGLEFAAVLLMPLLLSGCLPPAFSNNHSVN
jgi:hypothetical protein